MNHSRHRQRRSRLHRLFAAVAALGMLTQFGTATAAGEPPEAFDGFAGGLVDQPVDVFLSAFDPDGEPITFSIVSPPTDGALDDCTSGFCTYTPNAGFIGIDSFTFTASDGDLTSNVATFQVDIQENLPPVASDVSLQSKRDRPVEVFFDAFDPNGQPITIVIVTPPTNGILDDCSIGSCTYTPNAGFTGTDTAEYVASDGVNLSDPATLSIEILASAMSVVQLADPSGAAALAADLAGSGVTISNVVFTGDPRGAGSFTGGTAGVGIDAGVVLSSGAAGDVVGPNLQDGWTTSLGQPGDADLSALSGVGTLDATILEFDLVPDSDQLVFDYVFASEEYNEFVNSSFNDAFAFFVNGTNCALVEGQPITINTVNNGNPYDSDPRSNPSYYVNNDLDDGGGALDTEMDGMTVVLTCIAPVVAGATNTIKLAIADGSDSALDSAVFLRRGSFTANTAPVAIGASFTTNQDVPVPITLTATDAEGDALTYTVTSGPTNGTLSGTAPNLTYTPNPGFTGSDSFQFVADDGALTSAPATVSISVEADDTNTAPVADDQSVTTSEGVAVAIVLTGTDADGDPLTYSVTGGPTNGSLSGTAPNLTYTPNPGFSGSDQFTFVVDDGQLTSAPATVSISVEPINGPPTVDAGEAVSGAEGSPVLLGTAAVGDPDGDPVTTTWSWAPGAGVDAGASCSFTDASSVSTSITCTDDGEYVLTLTADDGNNPPVADTTTLTLVNVDPTASITSPGDGATFGVGAAVSLTVALADAGSNDSHQCTIDWGDGTTTIGVVAAGSCTSSHAYSEIGVPTVLATVVDDDGGSATDSIMLVVTSATAQVTGGGWYLAADGTRISLGLVAEGGPGGAAGQVQVRVHNTDRYHGTTVASVTVADTTAVITGTGRWNGVDGYGFRVVVTDQGNGKSKKSAGPDLVSVRITDPSGAVVHESNGALGGGNLKVR